MVAGARFVGGRYELAEILGAGGMATVWSARDRVLHRDVAVKLLNAQYAADPGFLARFRREAQHAAALNHPGLVAVFDSGTHEDTAFIVMELVTGPTLRQVLDQAGRLSPAEAVRIALAVCEALTAVHAAGLVHRDIKPANIMLAASAPDDDRPELPAASAADGEEAEHPQVLGQRAPPAGRVKLLDFGIARADGTHGGTRTQMVLGTAAYLSPEQASGEPATPRSDLYALGCMLFEMLTGEPPFTAETAVALAYRQVHDDPGPPSARVPGLPPMLDQVTARLLAKDPANRPAGASAARALLLGAMPPGQTTLLDELLGSRAPEEDSTSTGTAGGPMTGTTPPAGAAPVPGGRRLRPAETVLTAALAVSLIAIIVLLFTRPTATVAALSTSPPSTPSHQAPRPTPSPTPSPRKTPRPSPRTRPAPRPTPTPTRASKTPARPPAHHGGAPSTAVAAAAFVGDLTSSVADGQVTQHAGQQMFGQLQQLLFGPPGPGPQQVGQRYAQLVQIYDQNQAHGQITGAAVAVLRRDIHAIGVAFRVL